MLFITWNIYCQTSLACEVSVEKSADSFMGALWYVTNCFSFAALKILSLSVTFAILIMMCLGLGLFASHLFGTCFLDLHVFFLHQIREVFCHYFFTYVLNFLLSFLSFWYPHDEMLVHLKLSQRLLVLSSLFWFLFSVLIGCLLLSYLPNLQFDSRLHPLYC